MKWRVKFEIAEISEIEQENVASSEYLEAVQRGAFYSPEPLLLTENVVDVSDQLVSVDTKPGSQKKSEGRWFGVETKDLIIERDTLLPVYRSQDLKPFKAKSSAYLIAPTDDDGTHLLDPKHCESRYPRLYSYWLTAERLYLDRRRPSSADSLFENLDFKKYISKQLTLHKSNDRLKVIYNKSGKNLRAASVTPSEIAGQTLYWLLTSSIEEALYLCGILNAPCMQEVWDKRRTSKMHFDKSIFRRTPITVYDHKNPLHIEIVDIANMLSESSNESLVELNEPVQELFRD